MTQPAVNITELDGALGILPSTAGRLMAFVGAASAGPVNTPATFARVKDVVTNFASGPLVEAVGHAIDTQGKPVLVIRSGNTTAGTVGTITSVATGTAAVTVTASPTPDDDYEILVKVIAGGTRGVAGITYQVSLDGGRNFGAVTALGTGTSFPITGAGGVSFAIASGTLVAGDTFYARSVAPCWNTSELSSALAALVASQVAWEQVQIIGPIDANAFDAIETKMSALRAAGKPRSWIGNCRVPAEAESEATYLASVSGVFSAKVSTFGALCAGAAKITSGVSGRKYRRPLSHSVAAFHSALSEEQNGASIKLGALPGVSIRDDNGNPDEHDESINPGLDDARFVTARTFDGYPGVYINRPRLFSADGSDYALIPHRRVLNLAEIALLSYFRLRLNEPIQVSRTTGFILETEALEIESGARNSMKSVLMAKPKASAVNFVLSRTDNILSTKTLTGDGRVIPLGYPEFINLSLGFENPALQIVQV
jgi:hypothetical protein